MLFTSISFLYYFLPILLIFYFVVPKKFKNLILLIFSLIFYMYGEPKYIILMLIEIFIAYIGGILIEKYKSKDIFVITLIIHIGLLIFFKYTDFLITNVNGLFNTNISVLNLSLPIGISFYTFQIISYIIDVYRGTVKAQKNFLYLATYVSLFPQLIAGPIVRYETVEDELKNRKHSFESFSYGVTRFIIGLSKKVIIANVLGEMCSKLGVIDEKTIVLYWLSAIGYMLQIYLDFSAYSDMAIGLGKMFGFNFLENFNYPYISLSITEFWRRWHISLSSWFKDYIYIPLGGNRCSKLKNLRNIMVVWCLTGIWHGASWNFVLWGVLFGVILIIEKLWLKNILDKLPNFIKRFYVLFIVMISFIIFNSESISDIITNITGLFNYNLPFINSDTLYYLNSYIIIIISGIIASTPLFRNIIVKFKNNYKFNNFINLVEPIFNIVLLIVVTCYLIDNSYNPFLYFRF